MLSVQFNIVSTYLARSSKLRLASPGCLLHVYLSQYGCLGSIQIRDTVVLGANWAHYCMDRPDSVQMHHSSLLLTEVCEIPPSHYLMLEVIEVACASDFQVIE